MSGTVTCRSIGAATCRRVQASANDRVGTRLRRFAHPTPPYSTVTDFARLRGWSTSVPMNTAV